MLFSFKHLPSDFIVREIITTTANPDGDFWYINIEKTDQNTMDIIAQLCKNTGLTRSQIGVCGLKDKKAITSQRISIHRPDLQKQQLTEDDVCKIVTDTGVTIRGDIYTDQALSVWSHEGNMFHIRLRPKRNISDELKSDIKSRIQYIQDNGFPNCYGQQRFGKNNFEKAKAALASWETEWYHLKLKLQAYPNMYFNTLALERFLTWSIYVDGDICIHHSKDWYEWGIYCSGDHWSPYIIPIDINNKTYISDHIYTCTDALSIHPYNDTIHVPITPRTPRTRKPTWLMIGTDMLVCPPETDAYIYDNDIIQRSNILAYMPVAQTYKLTSYRRPLTCYPSNLEYSRDWDDLLLSFHLGVWSYATVLLWWLFKDIDEKTCVQNKWRILSV